MRDAPTALLAICVAASMSCRRVAPQPSVRARLPAHDASVRDVSTVDATRSVDVADAAVPAIGPPDPWADSGSLDGGPAGPEADRTRATMTALRAVIGFWRIERHTHTNCPRLEDLAHAPNSGFDPLTMQTDAWGSPFAIECLGSRVRLRSWGADHVRETADDIVMQ